MMKYPKVRQVNVFTRVDWCDCRATIKVRRSLIQIVAQ